jgi:hypothetical protein
VGRGDRMKLAAAVLLVAFGIFAAALPKQWIEDLLGFEPDAGNGLVELAIAVVPIVIGCGLAVSVLLSGGVHRMDPAERPPE